ncbi:ATPase AAA [Thermosipho melanesiensis]|uniref:DNA 3'-5' helicase n=1 Tax=Thermosipho melanesiensis (strain DSM 12029 / CIP 104789 / BI429) TaxID=391009 RepID=A6LL40_THEM4|nr:ATP-dependent helicase [Thermosipho melanesiensis]ABR30641.1 UvrD/REP helicase [Thermosipho melanesiensis BI429]OOC35718.1 ATPase AAA [Thermosipho melanesiensis]OOC39017.1 ATPase AAA [Thermosipho melanesiensis]OOC39165.1 ATPase AAA [Thermosipho melanesiensis]OOC41692.1 ATPase AAA [Thermosipho melanesiensis]
MIEDLKLKLDEEQYKAVVESSGKTLVIAGPGSGKTRVITYKIAHLIDSGIKPNEIMLVTFTKAAAREMLQRAKVVSKSNLNGITAGTFHHVCNLFLRRYGRLIGLKSNFTILDSEDAKDLMESTRSQLIPKSERKTIPTAKQLLSIASYMNNTLTSLREAIVKYNPRYLEQEHTIEQILVRYQQEKQNQNAVDYDDLLIHTLQILSTNKAIRLKESEKYKWILVDEFQDTNIVQFKIVELLSTVHKNLMVVGDDAQSIYSFRGARFENVIDFQKEATTFKIQTNYRSSQEIVNFINEMLPKKSIKKKLKATRTTGIKPFLVQVFDHYDEADFVANEILNFQHNGISLNEIAVLYRAHAHSLELQLALSKHNIPFKLYSGLRFTETAHVKDCLAFLKTTVNFEEKISWIRILKLATGIGNIKAENYAEKLSKHGYDAFNEIKEKSKDFHILRDTIKEAIDIQNPGERIKLFYINFYNKKMEEKFEDYRERKEDIERLIEMATFYKIPELFLNDILVSESYEIESENSEKEKVTLTTVHQAKGLEWKVVFILSVNPGDFPHIMSFRENNLDEEERLFYVAITRAKDYLYIIHSVGGSSRIFYGNDYILRRGKSFIDDIPFHLVEHLEYGVEK